MQRLLSGAGLFIALLTLIHCAPEKSGPPPAGTDAGVDAGPDGGVIAPPQDGGINVTVTYPTATLGGLDCDPMVPEQCGLPFPSNVYTKLNTSSLTGLNVNFGATTLPQIGGANIVPSQWSDSDGFSPGVAPMAYLAGATTTGMPDQNHIADSLMATSPTILVDTSTTPPSLVPQFSELDVTDSSLNDQVILIHPQVRLKDATRYIVALQNVVDSNGHAIAPNASFAALLNGTPAPMINVNGTMMTDPSVASRQSLYADIFAKLQAAGVSKAGLQLAWDFTTASKQNNVGQLESMYTQALAALPAAGPSYTIVSSSDNPDSLTARRIRGMISVPLFLDHSNVTIDVNPLDPDLSTGYTMQRDSNGNPVMNGFGQFEFIVNIPASAKTSITPLPILIQGHGLFSDRSEGMDALDGNYQNLIRLAQNQGYVTISMDLLGWRTPGGDTDTPGVYKNDWPADWVANPDTNVEDDQLKASGFVSVDAGLFRRMIDRGTQGMLNQLIAVKMMETSFASDPKVMIGPNNQSVIDTTRAYYRGDSQGGILGITFMALTHECLRGYLGEPGMPYSFLVMRSTDFGQFLGVLLGNYNIGNSAMNVQIVLGLMQMFWDRLEGDGFAPYITSNTISVDTPAHHIFMAAGLGDHQVTPLGAHILARAVGAMQLTPGVESEPIYGIPGMNGPFSGNAYQEFDFGILTDSADTVPQTDTAPTGPDDPHDWVRNTEASDLETDTFLKTGVAVDGCGSDAGIPATPTSCTFPLAYGQSL